MLIGGNLTVPAIIKNDETLIFLLPDAAPPGMHSLTLAHTGGTPASSGDVQLLIDYRQTVLATPSVCLSSGGTRITLTPPTGEARGPPLVWVCRFGPANSSFATEVPAAWTPDGKGLRCVAPAAPPGAVAVHALRAAGVGGVGGEGATALFAHLLYTQANPGP